MALTTTAQANKELIENAYAAFAQGDIPTVMRIFDARIFWHVPGRGPLSRDYHGHEEVLGFFQHFMELSQGTFRLRVDDVLAHDRRVIALVTESAAVGEDYEHRTGGERREECPLVEDAAQARSDVQNHTSHCRMRPGLPRHQSGEAVPTLTRGPLAQLVEQGTFNPKVAGSSPARPIWGGLAYLHGRSRRGI